MTNFSMQRRQFFRGKISAGKHPSPLPFRPPWAISEIIFDDVCTNCGDCIAVCPTNILSFGSGRLPIVDFSENECSFCGKCERICEANALDKDADSFPSEQAWDLTVTISEQCLSIRCITCRSCSDLCETGAIQFQLGLGGKATPHLSYDGCTGCGACIAPCPVNAIQISRKKTQ